MIKPWMFVHSQVRFPFDENLVGYWYFNEGKGGIAYDRSGYGNDGTLVNMEAADWVDGVVGKALDFDGTNEYVNCGNDASIQVDTAGSVSLWVRLEADKWCYAFDKGYKLNGGLTIGYYSSWRKRWLSTTYHDGYNYVYFGTPVLNEWTHLVVTYADNTLTYYVNGEYSISDSWEYGILTSGQDLLIGGLSRLWQGSIDEVRIYSTALTASEVKALYLYPGGK